MAKLTRDPELDRLVEQLNRSNAAAPEETEEPQLPSEWPAAEVPSGPLENW